MKNDICFMTTTLQKIAFYKTVLKEKQIFYLFKTFIAIGEKKTLQKHLRQCSTSKALFLMCTVYYLN